MSNTNLFIQAKTGDAAINYSALQVRQFIIATYPIEGVLGNGQLKVTHRAAGANMSVDVAAGGAAVKCDTVSNGGAYILIESATVNVTVPAAPVSGTRTHVVYERAYDPQADATVGTDYVSKPFLSQDTGSGAPVIPSAYALASILVPAGKSSILDTDITDLRGQASGPAPDAVVPISLTTSGAGRISVPHGMDTRPRFAALTLDSQNNSYKEYLVSIASDVVTWELRATATGSLASSGQSITGICYIRR